METWQTILVALGGNAVLLAVLGWLAKSLVTGLQQKDLAQFKATLTAEAETTIEGLRHQLQLVATEHQIRFLKLHETRAEVIAKLYELLVEAHWAAASFVSPMEWVGEPSKKEKYQTAQKATAEFYRFFERKKIYLPADLCNELDSFVRDMRKKTMGYGVYVMHESEYAPAHVEKEKTEKWHAAWRYFDEQVPGAKEALENELRKILGPSAIDERTNKSLKTDAVDGAA